MSTLQPYPALPPRLSAEVMALAVRAGTSDGVRPLSEQTILDVRQLPEEVPADQSEVERHLLILERPDEIDTTVLAYAHLEPTTPVSVEIVVDPEHRRSGLGTRLASAVLERHPDARFWAHGDLGAGRAMIESLGLSAVRELWQMSRPLRGEWSALPEVELPDGFAVRPFVVGKDEQAWLAVNARAFASHPEQGRVQLADLQARIQEPWFDPQGFLLVEDLRETHPRLAAFHWTKVEPAAPGHGTLTAGEVYVVGVDPDYQGKGLGISTTLVGLHHLRACGLDEVTLYVDGDNAAAIATYHRLGFERATLDVMFARQA